MLYRFTYCQWDDNVEVTYSTVEDPDEEQIVLLEHGADPFQNEEWDFSTVVSFHMYCHPRYEVRPVLPSDFMERLCSVEDLILCGVQSDGISIPDAIRYCNAKLIRLVNYNLDPIDLSLLVGCNALSITFVECKIADMIGYSDYIKEEENSCRISLERCTISKDSELANYVSENSKHIFTSCRIE